MEVFSLVVFWILHFLRWFQSFLILLNIYHDIIVTFLKFQFSFFSWLTFWITYFLNLLIYKLKNKALIGLSAIRTSCWMTLNFCSLANPLVEKLYQSHYEFHLNFYSNNVNVSSKILWPHCEVVRWNTTLLTFGNLLKHASFKNKRKLSRMLHYVKKFMNRRFPAIVLGLLAGLIVSLGVAQKSDIF